MPKKSFFCCGPATKRGGGWWVKERATKIKVAVPPRKTFFAASLSITNKTSCFCENFMKGLTTSAIEPQIGKPCSSFVTLRPQCEKYFYSEMFTGSHYCVYQGMVFISDGCSFYSAHIWSKSGISIWWRHLVTSKEWSNSIFFFSKNTCLYIMRAQRVLSNHLI